MSGNRPAEGQRRRWNPITVLLLLATIPAALLFLAYGESRKAADMATDINRSGSLRYRSLYLYAITSSSTTGSEKWPGALAEMTETYRGLRLSWPRETAQMEASWATFNESLLRNRRVSWVNAERMREDADSLTNLLNAEAVKRSALSDQLFLIGTLSLALSLPLSVHLIRRLQISQDENDQHIRSYAELSSRYQNLFHNTPTACFVYNDQGRITDWNAASCTLFEKSADQVRGQALWDAITRPSRRESAKDSVDLLLSGEPLVDFDWTYDTPSGVSKTVVSTATPLYNGSVVVGGICVSTDVTQARALQETQRLLQTELADSEEHLRNITSRLRCLLWEADVMVADAPPEYQGRFWDAKDRTFLHWNLQVLHDDEAYRWLPVYRKPGQDFGQAWQESISPDEADANEARAREALRKGEDNYSQEFTCQLADGSTQWLLENVEIRRVEEEGNGLRWHLVGVCTDISAQKEAEEQLVHLATELKRSNDSLQDFAYIASHDLKEPLRKIQTFGAIIKKRAKSSLPPDCGEYLERMIAASVRMQTLVDGLLEYSKASRKPRALLQVDLNVIFQEVLTDLEEQIVASGARIVAGRLPVICTDAMQMRQLFQNLISNAIKFRKPGQAPNITIGWDDENAPRPKALTKRTVQISVTDDGIGFDQRYAEHVFEIFEQLDTDAARGQGTGLGLSICRAIVERFGGSITAYSEPDQGATFTVILPVG